MGCHFLLPCIGVKSEREVTQSCLTLRDPMDCSLPGSSIHGIFQARVLEWGAIAFSILCLNLTFSNSVPRGSQLAYCIRFKGYLFLHSIGQKFQFLMPSSGQIQIQKKLDNILRLEFPKDLGIGHIFWGLPWHKNREFLSHD